MALAMAKQFRVEMEENFIGKNLTSSERGLIDAKANEILDAFVEAGWLTGDAVQQAYQITELTFEGDRVNIKIDGTETPVLNFIFGLINLSAFGL